jgi:hypothetical protein
MWIDALAFSQADFSDGEFCKMSDNSAILTYIPFSICRK